MNNENSFSSSIMRPALGIIRVLFYLGMIGSAIFGTGTILAILATFNNVKDAPQGIATCGMLFLNCLMMILSLFILRCFVLCMDSIEKTVRRIEFLIYKDRETDE